MEIKELVQSGVMWVSILSDTIVFKRMACRTHGQKLWMKASFAILSYSDTPRVPFLDEVFIVLTIFQSGHFLLKLKRFVYGLWNKRAKVMWKSKNKQFFPKKKDKTNFS